MTRDGHGRSPSRLSWIDDLLAMSAPEKLPQFLGWGTLHGVATSSAYAVTEFVLVSLFGITRPYSSFARPYWHMTALLMAGYLIAGVIAGMFAGALAYRIGTHTRLAPTSIIERITVLILIGALVGNVLSAPFYTGAWFAELLATLFLGALALVSLRSTIWLDRLRYLTNPWVVSFLWLGLGQDLGLRDLGVARQLTDNINLWAFVFGGILVAVALASFLMGCRFRTSSRWPQFGVQASIGPALLLVLLALGMPLWKAHANGPPLLIGVPNAPKPNVVLIVLDTVRADHLSLYGYPLRTTPNLDELARDSSIYSNAISPSDFTLTSHASLFTGVYPSWHGAFCEPPANAFGRELSPGVPTLAEILARQGYRTLGVAANLYVRADFGLQRGFTSFHIPRPVPMLITDNWYLLRRNLRRALTVVTDTAQFDRIFSRSEDVNRQFFLSFAELGASRTPFFAFLNFMDAHYPYVPPAPFDHFFPGKIPGITQDDLDRQQETISSGHPVPAGYVSHTASQYDGAIRYMDEQIGNVIAWLRAEHIYDNTMIIVTSDHGESFGERSRVGHANSAYQNLLHAALLIKYPNSALKGAVTAPVSLIDVAPTVLRTLGFPVAPGMQGISLLESPPERRNIFGETFPCPVLHSPDCPQGCLSRTIISWPDKLITTSNGNRELFDLETDPRESGNQFSARPDVAQRMRTDLSLWIKTMPRLNRPKSQVDKQSLQVLRGLGYLN